MTERSRTGGGRARPTPRLVLVVLLSLLVYGAGANVGAGTVLLLAAGMAVGSLWSVTGFLRRAGELSARTGAAFVATEGYVELPLHVTVPRGVIGVIGVEPRLPPPVAAELVALHDGRAARLHRPPSTGPLWTPLPRADTSAEVQVGAVLARGDDQQLHVRMEVTDLFGLVRRRGVLPGPVVDALPASGAAAAFDADSVEGAEDDQLAHALTANGTPGTELRPWRPGEPIRAVHWPASERAAQLLVRPRAPETRQRRTLTVEEHGWSREALDRRCRDVAATADRLVHAGVEVQLAVGDRTVPWGLEALQLLATLTPNAASVTPPSGGA